MSKIMKETVTATPKEWAAMHATERESRMESLRNNPMVEQRAASVFPQSFSSVQVSSYYPDIVMARYEHATRLY